jgi:hypothetical protein
MQGLTQTILRLRNRSAAIFKNDHRAYEEIEVNQSVLILPLLKQQEKSLQMSVRGNRASSRLPGSAKIKL